MKLTYNIRFVSDEYICEEELITGFSFEKAHEYAVKCVTKQINYLLFAGKNVSIVIENALGKRVATYYIY